LVQISLIAIGKTSLPWVREGTDIYAKRLQRYGRFQFVATPDIKARPGKPDPAWVREREAEVLAKHIANVDYLILLDERGKTRDSVAFARHLESLQVRGLKHLAFVIGGPYGFAPSVYAKANEKWSLGPMTFSHQMVRAFVCEQIYRAHTILKGEPYHHV
jgi:23S rRNA (pseudouridine1915-N3)-methyltransferase